MRTEYIFPTVLIALDVGAAAVYAAHGDGDILTVRRAGLTVS